MEIDDEELEMRSSPSPVQNELAGKDEPIDPVMTVEILEDVTIGLKRPIWEKQTLQDVEGHEAPCATFRESKRPQRFLSYVALMSHIIDFELFSCEEASS